MLNRPNVSMLCTMAERPIRWIKGLPCSFWSEGGFRIFVIFWKGKFHFKARCSTCKKCVTGSVYVMSSITEHSVKTCQH